MTALQGPLTFATVPQRLEETWQGEIDLSGITQLDSAGLSLLLEMKRRARARGVVLGFSRVPSSVRHLADHFGISGILGLQQ